MLGKYYAMLISKALETAQGPDQGSSCLYILFPTMALPVRTQMEEEAGC